MKKLILSAAALVLLSAPAFAQVTSGSSSGAYSGIYAPNNSISIPSKSLRTTGNAIAPSMAAAGIDNCAGSISGGIGLMGVGVSGGTTYTMNPCNWRANARAMRELGQGAAALHYLAARDEEMRASLAAVGAIVLTGPQSAPAAYASAPAAPRASNAPRPSGNIAGCARNPETGFFNLCK